jgi:hypothetical protein
MRASSSAKRAAWRALSDPSTPTTIVATLLPSFRVETVSRHVRLYACAAREPFAYLVTGRTTSTEQ